VLRKERNVQRLEIRNTWEATQLVLLFLSIDVRNSLSNNHGYCEENGQARRRVDEYIIVASYVVDIFYLTPIIIQSIHRIWIISTFFV
jgi:hypothetical protein